MGIWDAFSDLVEAVTPWSVVEAEAPANESEDKKDSEKPDTDSSSKSDDSADDDSKEEDSEKNDDEESKSKDDSEEGGDDDAEEKDEDGEEEEGEGGDDDEDEEEDDEEEIVDPKETLEEECKNSTQCAPAKHHFDDCVERVQKQEGDGEAKEDCVEEFFHLAHCATACAAPKLWSKLK